MAYLKNEEIKDLSKNLNTAIAENRSGDARTILEKLQAGVNPVEDVIRATKIGQTVAKLRTNSDKSISQLAKDLVQTWKTKVNSQRGTKKKDSPVASVSPSTTVTSPVPVESVSNAPTPSASDNKTQAPPDFDILGDKTRNACLKLLFQSLEGGLADVETIYRRAKEIEEAAFNNIAKGQINNEYRTKIRSLTLNLKDKKNPALRESVATGFIPAERLIVMTPEEMASDEKKAEREALQMQNLFKAKAAAAQEAETDAFQCAKCHQRKCTYYQKQTRSADEPMTTFVSCCNCNHKWKFC